MFYGSEREIKLFDWFEHLRFGFKHLPNIIRPIWALAVRIQALADHYSIDLSICGSDSSTCRTLFDRFEHLRFGFKHLPNIIRPIWALAVWIQALAEHYSIDLSTCGLDSSTCRTLFDRFEHLRFVFKHFEPVLLFCFSPYIKCLPIYFSNTEFNQFISFQPAAGWTFCGLMSYCYNFLSFVAPFYRNFWKNLWNLNNILYMI